MIWDVRPLAVSALLVAACSDPPGVTLEVIRTDKAVMTVELYLGEPCEGCPDVMAPPDMTPRRSRVFEVNDPAVFSSAEWNDDRAGFRLVSATDKNQKLPLIMAVGFDASDVPIAASSFYDGEIPVDYAERWVTTLVPATPIADGMPGADGERVAVWPAQRRGPRCVMLEHGRSGADAVVPADDTDCDGLGEATDCAPFIPNAVNAVPTLATANCVTPVDGPNSTQLCMLGGPICTERAAPTVVTCEALDVDYCAPKKLCSVCPAGDFPCIQAAIRDASLVTPQMNGVECRIPLQPDGSECEDSSRRRAELDISGLLQGGETKCVDVHISHIALPISLQHALELGTASIEVRDFQQPCKVTIEWRGKFDRTMGNEQLLLAEVELDNGKHIVAPFYVHLADSCFLGMSCGTVVPDLFDTMFQCVKPAPSSTTCTPTSTVCGGGIECGARCCNVGESCVDGECRCGAGPHCLDNRSCVDAPAAGCGTRCSVN